MLDMLSHVTLLVSMTKDYGHSLRKTLNIDFYLGVILLNVRILSRKFLRRIVNNGPKGKESEYMPLTSGNIPEHHKLCIIRPS